MRIHVSTSSFQSEIEIDLISVLCCHEIELISRQLVDSQVEEQDKILLVAKPHLAHMLYNVLYLSFDRPRRGEVF
jgi:hypothetical protein